MLTPRRGQRAIGELEILSPSVAHLRGPQPPITVMLLRLFLAGSSAAMAAATAAAPPAWLPRNPACAADGCPLPGLGQWSTAPSTQQHCGSGAAPVAMAEVECQAAALDAGHSTYQYEPAMQRCHACMPSQGGGGGPAAGSQARGSGWVVRGLTSPLWEAAGKLSPGNSAAQNTQGWADLVTFLEEHPGAVAAIPGGVFDVTPLAGATGLVNATVLGGQRARTVFRVHNATNAHVAAWSHSHGLHLRDLSFVAAGISWAAGETTAGLNW